MSLTNLSPYNTRQYTRTIEEGKNSQLRFCQLEKNSGFESVFEKYYGKKIRIENFLSKAKLGEVLLCDNYQPLGLIIYKKTLIKINDLKNCFIIKSFIALNVEEQNKTNTEQTLLDRLVKIGNSLSAQSMAVKIKNCAHSIEFLESKGFKTRDPKSNSRNGLLYMHIDSNLDLRRDNSDNVSSITKKSEEDPSQKRSLKRVHSMPNFEMPPVKKQKIEDHNAISTKVESRPQLYRRQSEPARNTYDQKIHKLPMKGTEYFDYIMSGVKQFEGRINGPACKSMRTGDLLRLFDNREGWGIICEITSKDCYNSFEEMLRNKTVLAMLPQLTDKAKYLPSEQLISEGVKIYKSFPGSNRVASDGAVAIGVKFIKKI